MRRLLLLAVAALALVVLGVVAYFQLVPPESPAPTKDQEETATVEPDPARPEEPATS